MATRPMAPAPAAGDHTLAKVKAYLMEHHVPSILWHYTLNNNSSTRPNMHGGKVMISVHALKTFIPPARVGPGIARPDWQCILKLPHSFAAGDHKEIHVVGSGATKTAASEDACCTAIATLLFEDAKNVVLRPKHWLVTLDTLMQGLHTIIAAEDQAVLHQPLAVHVRQKGKGKVGAAMLSDERTEAVAALIRSCLEGHGGRFDPSNIRRKWVKCPQENKAPWAVLDDLLEKGELRGFVASHPEFEWHPRDDGKGMIITWAGGSTFASQTPPTNSSPTDPQQPPGGQVETISVPQDDQSLSGENKLPPQEIPSTGVWRYPTDANGKLLSGPPFNLQFYPSEKKQISDKHGADQPQVALAHGPSRDAPVKAFFDAMD